ncbi:MAG: Rieske 2Fe-2S domain-containing protein, partial [Candidatus Methylacidiphilales bacterium]
MSVAYTAVGWNRQKGIYDLAVMVVLLLGPAAFGAAIAIAHPATTAETFILRFTAMSALVLLHVILAIGPLARLDTRFLPLLYNRRHLGVTMFVLAAIHGVFAIVQFHALGDSNPLVSTITAYASDYTTWLEHPKLLSRFPFESLGAAALLIFLVMAATSHDFWLKNLGPSFWKLMHMAVYIAYALVIGHVVLGALQSERSPLYPVLLTAGCAVICGLHVAAWWRERSVDVRHTQTVQDGYELVGRADEMAEGVGRVVVASGSRIALFKHKGRLFAISNTCRHQGGPLGEGRVVYDCLTCPWHGYQYRLEDGCSPPPFTEIVPTYPVRVIDGSIYVRPQMLPLQTKSEGEA